jgi:serine/threonine protein kinase
MPITPGETILNKYHILRLIGEGGMARVWLAEETAFAGRLVAIKEPRRNLPPADQEEIERRYQREIQVCATLKNAGVPNLVEAITAEPYEGRMLLVMAYMPGGDLAGLLSEHPSGLPVERAVQIARDICTALAGVHSHPMEIVHRDIKPSNILFDDKGVAHLADFGLAQLAGVSGRSELAGGAHPGTPLYMPPEQARTTEYLTPAADVYAVGCILFEMLTGKRYKRVQPGTPASSLRAEAPAWLGDVVAKALEENPWSRWETAGEMNSALSTGATVPATPSPQAAAPVPKPATHRRIALPRVLAAAGGVIAIVFLAIFVLPGLLSDGGQKEPTAVVELVTTATDTTAPQITVYTPKPSLTSTPTQANTQTPVPPTHSPVPPTPTHTSIPLPSVQSPSLVADSLASRCSDMILVGGADSKVYRIDTSTGTIIEAIGLSGIQLGLLAWNQTYGEAYSADYNGDVVSVIHPSPLSEKGIISQDVGWNAHSMAVSPDGRRLYVSFASRGDSGSYRQVGVFDPAARTSLDKIRLTDTYGQSYVALSSDGEMLYVSWDRNLEIYSTQDLSLLRREKSVTSSSGRLALSPDDRYLFIAQTGRIIKWNINAGRVENTISLPQSNGRSWVEVSPDGQKVWVGGSTSGNLAREIYEVEGTLNDYKTLPLQDEPYSFVRSSDAWCLYSTSFDGGVMVTELSTGKSRLLATVEYATGIVVIRTQEP